jgi:hypothetical protein
LLRPTSRRGPGHHACYGVNELSPRRLDGRRFRALISTTFLPSSPQHFIDQFLYSSREDDPMLLLVGHIYQSVPGIVRDPGLILCVPKKQVTIQLVKLAGKPATRTLRPACGPKVVILAKPFASR